MSANTQQSSYYTEVREGVDDYTTTVHAVLCFAACVLHNGVGFIAGTEFGSGRRMMTSEHNVVQPATVVTPDLVAQKSAAYGIVA